MDPFNQDNAGVADATGAVKEEVLFDGRLPLRAFVGQHGLLYVLLLGWNVGLLIAYFRSLAWRVKITSQRVVVLRGFIARKEEDIPLYRATDIGFDQTVAGRLLGVGKIDIFAEDATAPRYSFPFVRPAEYKEIIRGNIMSERRRLKTLNMD